MKQVFRISILLIVLFSLLEIPQTVQAQGPITWTQIESNLSSNGVKQIIRNKTPVGTNIICEILIDPRYGDIEELAGFDKVTLQKAGYLGEIDGYHKFRVDQKFCTPPPGANAGETEFYRPDPVMIPQDAGEYPFPTWLPVFVLGLVLIFVLGIRKLVGQKVRS
jgi:hypothetical protein